MNNKQNRLKINIERTEKKTYDFSQNNETLGQLIYKGIFSESTEIRIVNTRVYKIESVGLFDTKFNVLENGKETAILKMNWKRNWIINFKNGETFVFKSQNILTNKYIIKNKEDKILILYGQSLAWAKFSEIWNNFNYNYEIEFEHDKTDVFLILLGVFLANRSINVISGLTMASV